MAERERRRVVVSGSEEGRERASDMGDIERGAEETRTAFTSMALSATPFICQ